MILKQISLINFRNYDRVDLNLGKGINIIYGDNAQGKTNLLESIYVLGLTKSHRLYIDENLIKSNSLQASIKGTLSKDDNNSLYEVKISHIQKNLYIDNNLIKKKLDYISNINIIIFYPEDLELVKGSPFTRRKYLDIELSQLYKNYLIVFNYYNRINKIKNNVLKKETIDTNYLNILNGYLLDKASNIYYMRKKYIDKINQYASKIFFDLTGMNNFKIIYKTQLSNIESIEAIKKSIQELQKKYMFKEQKIRKCLYGPHLDDIEFFIEDMNIKLYGSQGQQRMAVLSLKLSELEIYRNYKNEYPILLLDDVFSELDNKKKNKLLKYIGNSVQTIITTTDLKNLNQKLLKNSKVLKISDGKIKEEVEKYGY